MLAWQHGRAGPCFLVDDGSREPRPELCSALELTNMAISVRVGVLERVFGVRILPQDRPRDTEEPAEEPAVLMGLRWALKA